MIQLILPMSITLYYRTSWHSSSLVQPCTSDDPVSTSHLDTPLHHLDDQALQTDHSLSLRDDVSSMVCKSVWNSSAFYARHTCSFSNRVTRSEPAAASTTNICLCHQLPSSTSATYRQSTFCLISVLLRSTTHSISTSLFLSIEQRHTRKFAAHPLSTSSSSPNIAVTANAGSDIRYSTSQSTPTAGLLHPLHFPTSGSCASCFMNTFSSARGIVSPSIVFLTDASLC
jgi:hypothetical protein